MDKPLNLQIEETKNGNLIRNDTSPAIRDGGINCHFHDRHFLTAAPEFPVASTPDVPVLLGGQSAPLYPPPVQPVRPPPPPPSSSAFSPPPFFPFIPNPPLFRPMAMPPFFEQSSVVRPPHMSAGFPSSTHSNMPVVHPQQQQRQQQANQKEKEQGWELGGNCIDMYNIVNHTFLIFHYHHNIYQMSL